MRSSKSCCDALGNQRDSVSAEPHTKNTKTFAGGPSRSTVCRATPPPTLPPGASSEKLNDSSWRRSRKRSIGSMITMIGATSVASSPRVLINSLKRTISGSLSRALTVLVLIPTSASQAQVVPHRRPAIHQNRRLLIAAGSSLDLKRSRPGWPRVTRRE